MEFNYEGIFDIILPTDRRSKDGKCITCKYFEKYDSKVVTAHNDKGVT